MDNKLKNVNDRFAQACRSLNLTDEQKEIRNSQVSECNHEFVCLKRGMYVGGYNHCFENLVIECVHCGLTNKLIYLTDLFNRDPATLFSSIGNKCLDILIFKKEGDSVPYENVLFYQAYKNNQLKNINLISDKEVHNDHATILYKLAKSIEPQATNEELVQIMIKLSEIETLKETIRISSIEDTDNLLERYNKQESKQYVFKAKQP